MAHLDMPGSDSCMDNKAPGAPNLAILSFKSGFHGRMLGSLSATRSKAIHKVRLSHSVEYGEKNLD